MRRSDTGSSKMIRIFCSPCSPARHPGPPFELNANSMGKSGSSDVTSTVAICSRSSQLWSDSPPCWSRCDPTILFRILSFSQHTGHGASCQASNPGKAPLFGGRLRVLFVRMEVTPSMAQPSRRHSQPTECLTRDVVGLFSLLGTCRPLERYLATFDATKIVLHPITCFNSIFYSERSVTQISLFAS